MDSNSLVWLPKEPGSRRGWVCVRYTTTSLSEPERRTYWWPVTPEAFDNDVFYQLPEVADGKEQPLYHTTFSEVYSFNRTPGAYGYVELRLVNGGKTEAVKIETEAVPKPKVRKGVELEWRGGRWCKYTKRDGWVPA
jgi:hypothetical protein